MGSGTYVSARANGSNLKDVTIDGAKKGKLYSEELLKKLFQEVDQQKKKNKLLYQRLLQLTNQKMSKAAI